MLGLQLKQIGTEPTRFTTKAQMSQPQGRTSDRAATAEELLEWLIEHQELRGAAGLSTQWPLEDFPKVFSVVADTPDQPMLSEGKDVDLDTCLGWAVRDHMRDEWLEKTIKEHHALYPSVDKLLYSRLRALGVPASQLDQMNPNQKLSMLANAKTPRKPDIPTFIVFLILAKDTEGNEIDKIELTFRLDDSFVRFQAVLRDISCYSAMRHGQAGGYTLCDGPWCYRFVGSNGLVVPGMTRVEMVDERGYRMMVRQLVQRKYRAASFCHVSVFFFPSLFHRPHVSLFLF